MKHFAVVLLSGSIRKVHKCDTNLDHDATLDVLLDGGHRKEDEEACGENEDKADLDDGGDGVHDDDGGDGYGQINH